METLQPFLFLIILVRTITLNLSLSGLLTGDDIGGYISLRRSAVHKNRYSTLHIFLIIAHCYFSYFHFGRTITLTLVGLLTWNFILVGEYILFNRSTLYKKSFSGLYVSIVIDLCCFSYFLYKPLARDIAVVRLQPL